MDYLISLNLDSSLVCISLNAYLQFLWWLVGRVSGCLVTLQSDSLADG